MIALFPICDVTAGAAVQSRLPTNLPRHGPVGHQINEVNPLVASHGRHFVRGFSHIGIFARNFRLFKRSKDFCQNHLTPLDYDISSYLDTSICC
jgi:hypothetical protein